MAEAQQQQMGTDTSVPGGQEAPPAEAGAQQSQETQQQTPRLSVFGDQHCFPYTTLLRVNEKSEKALEDAEVLDANGSVHFKLKSLAVENKRRRAMYDALDKPVCCSVVKTGLKRMAYICAGDSFNPDLAVAEVRKTVLSLKSHLQVFLRGNETKTADLEVEGTITDKAFTIMNKDKVVLAEVSRLPNTKSAVLTAANNYQVIIHPGTDVAFVSYLVCAIEELVIESNINKI